MDAKFADIHHKVDDGKRELKGTIYDSSRAKDAKSWVIEHRL